jgi:hypothetical protein
LILTIVYVVAQRMLSLVLLGFRSDQSKDLELAELQTPAVCGGQRQGPHEEARKPGVRGVLYRARS